MKRRDTMDRFGCVWARQGIAASRYYCAMMGEGISPQICAACRYRQPAKEARAVPRKALIKARGERSILRVAQEVGVRAESLAKYESGERQPQDKTKMRLAEYYGVHVRQLFGGE